MNQQSDSNPTPPASPANDTHGLIATLFDFSFSSFVTTKFIRFIYTLLLLGAALGVLTFIGAGFRTGFLHGVIALLVSPIIAFIYVFLVRIWTEIIIVIFRIAEHLKNIDAKTSPAA